MRTNKHRRSWCTHARAIPWPQLRSDDLHRRVLVGELASGELLGVVENPFDVSPAPAEVRRLPVVPALGRVSVQDVLATSARLHLERRVDLVVDLLAQVDRLLAGLRTCDGRGLGLKHGHDTELSELVLSELGIFV